MSNLAQMAKAAGYVEEDTGKPSDFMLDIYTGELAHQLRHQARIEYSLAVKQAEARQLVKDHDGDTAAALAALLDSELPDQDHPSLTAAERNR